MAPPSGETIGVLIMAYGGPGSLEEVAAYLADIRGGRPTSQQLLDEITDRYRQIGGSSPILDRTNAQAAAIERTLNAESDADTFRVYVGMRHWHPYIADIVPRMIEEGVDRIVAIVMAPHFSRMSIGAYMGNLDKAVLEHGSDIPFAKVESWKDEPSFIDAVARRIEDALELFPPNERADVPLLFTAHSLPARVLESGDAYPQELQTSVALVVDRLNPKHWCWAFQSQGATAEPWLGPTVEETLEALAAEGHINVLLVPIGFVCDHVEVLFDVDIEHRHQARDLGIRLERTEMLNDDPGLADAVASAVRRAVSSNVTPA